MNKILLLALAALCSVAACNRDKSNDSSSRSLSFSTVEPGSLINRGDSVSLQLSLPHGVSFDSVVYLLNDKPYITVKDSADVWLKTDSLGMGSQLITANVFRDGQSESASTNIVVVAAKMPEQYSFSVVNTFPHDAKAYTQGLEYHDGFLYESTGQRGKSTLRKVELKTGKVVQKIDLPAKYFGEGMTFVGDKIIQLTWEEGVGLVYDRNSFEKVGEFPYQASKEGWGLCFDGERLIKSDGTNRLYFLNKDTYREEGFIEVYNSKGPVDKLNELEYVDGKIYANVYYSDVIVVIDPHSGQVEAEINLIGLLPQKDVTEDTNVLNGIAYDRQGKRLYVTGKNWDKLFEIKLLGR
ncbi:glutaminyl-peptide cyclotransferase [Olivibacter sp. XZL3]|uniref:glutaminyl-peptide cyclotransferase n=1 Tax=Olivibacter sp. XZL3 TaxID=1735116 RepID=UPI001F106BF8|nr:glutaminyl-peptide cyclotransferase [Olivibacter sp. XZL3]